MCVACKIDEARVEQFGEKLLGIVNGGALALMVSIGHRTGLFDTMGALDEPTSSTAIAEAAALNERYVREWLGAMVAGGIVEHEAGLYHLPREVAGFLTRAAAPNNLAVSMQFIPVLASVEDKILECFRKGGGLGYGDYPRFHEVMAEESAQTVVAGLDEHIVPLVPGLESQLASGIRVLDVGCGSGRALMHLAGRFPKSSFTGLDYSREAVEIAQREATRLGLGNLRFIAGDAARLLAGLPFDLITAFDAIHDQAQPAEVLARIHAALKPGGVFLMQDIKAATAVEDNRAHPLGAFVYTISALHCMSVSLGAGGAGLGAAWGRELALQMLHEAGFRDTVVRELPHDMTNYFYVSRKD
jgi:SAM-dependent methyltransferase